MKFPKIIEIKSDVEFQQNSYKGYDGYEIKLDNGVSYFVGISNKQQCCESWGYFDTLDDLNELIGLELRDIVFTDSNRSNSYVSEFTSEHGVEIESCLFVTINTNKGSYQLVLYNEHNGYYSHDVVLVKQGVIVESEYI